MLMREKSASMVRHIENEVKMHMSFCETYGLTKAEVENSEESQGTCIYAELNGLINALPF